MKAKSVKKIDILHYECVDSTNRVAMQYEEKKHLLTFVSDTQTNGRGRMGRSFFSYNGGLYMSVILDPGKISIPFHLCTPAAALAVKYTLEEYGVEKTQIKWVNDILLDGKKICGILTESRVEDSSVERLVVGIGINLENTGIAFPGNIEDKAGYAYCKAEKAELAADIASKLGELCNAKREDIVLQYLNNLAWIGDIVTVTDYSADNAKITGKITGINEDCFLKLELPDKSIKLLSSGEII